MKITNIKSSLVSMDKAKYPKTAAPTAFVESNSISNVSFGAINPSVNKSSLIKLFEEIKKFHLSEFKTRIKENNEILKFKKSLKYDKDFPDAKISSVIADTAIKDIRAKKEFYLFSKYNDFLPKGISQSARINIMSEVNDRNLALTKRLYDDPYFPKDAIPVILQDKDMSTFEFKEHFYNKLRDNFDHPIWGEYYKLKPYMDDLAFVMKQTDKEYLSFVGTLWNNPTIPKGAVLELVHQGPEDIKALKKIYALSYKNQYNWGTLREEMPHTDISDVRAPQSLMNDYCERADIIRNFLYYTNKNNIDKAVELCNSTNLNASMVEKALKI